MRRYSLDAIRGIGAVAVVQFHAGLLWQSAPHAYVAVDTFFALSGFVLAGAYKDVPVGTFFKARVRKLYPLYLAGTVLGTIVAVAKGANLWPLLPALVMLPAPVLGDFFPLNVPGWSLFIEFIVQWTHRLKTHVLIAIMAMAAYKLTGLTDFNVGWSWATLQAGLARALYAFPLGVLFYRAKFVPMVSYLALIPILLIMGSFYAQTAPSTYDIVVVGPILLMLALCFELPPRLRGVASYLGSISYPIYALHYPLLSPYQLVCKKLGLSGPLPVVAFILALVAVITYAQREPRHA